MDKLPRHFKWNNKMVNGRQFKIGQTFFLMGSGTKVEIVGKGDFAFILIAMYLLHSDYLIHAMDLMKLVNIKKLGKNHGILEV